MASDDTISSLSLNQLVRLNSRRSIWIQPLLWTAQHLALLECYFVDEPPLDQETREESSSLPLARISSDLLMLATGEPSAVRHVAFENLLPDELHRGCLQLRLRVNRKTIHTFMSFVFFEQYEEDPELLHIRFAYLDHSDIMFSRSMAEADLGPYGGAEWHHDPYLACVLVSLAQKQKRHVRPPLSLEGIIFTPCLLITCSAGSGVQLYRAEIPYTYLRMLEDPNLRLPNAVPFSMHRSEIPYMPDQSFQGRLAAAVSDIEPWMYQTSNSVPMDEAASVPVNEEFEAPSLYPAIGEKRKYDGMDEEPSRETKRSGPRDFTLSADGPSVTSVADGTL